jgi:hypothetical protein
MGLKLNLGCGQKREPGFVNVDKAGDPDLRWDLEKFPWPWQDGSASEIHLIHVLEHLGASSDVFIGVMKELYRVCEAGATIRIVVPHPRHDFYIGDPTHVRPVTPEMLQLFSKRENRRWTEMGAANTPLALYHDVDFQIDDVQYMLDEPYSSELKSGKLAPAEIQALVRKYNNVVTEIQVTMSAIKP